MLMDIFIEVSNNMLIRNSMSFVNNPCEATANEFIKNYFDSHSKDLLFNISFTEKDTMFSKSIHTMSMFLLGVKFKKLVDQRIENSIFENAPIDDIRFDYPWLLSCLYHDVFSDYEEKHKSGYPHTLPEFISKVKINHTTYNTNLPTEIIISEYTPIYKKETVENYYKYRINKDKIEHGIISGYYAFDRLTKNFIDNWKQKGMQDPFQTNLDGHTLNWNKNQIWIFALVADAIIVHNIWHTKEMNMVSKELVPDLSNKNEVKLSIAKTPLAYFLSLIDTVEPYKFFHKMNSAEPHDVFDELSIDLYSNKILIKKSDSFKYDFNIWYKKKMRDMGDWLEGTYATIADESTIEINLPDNN